MNEAEEVITKLGSVTKTAKGWKARCPAHDDHNPSLSITTGNDGRVQYHCYAGCSNESVVKAIKLLPYDATPQQKKNGNKWQGGQRKKIVKTYDYTDADGNLVYQVVRYEPKDFRQRQPDPDNPGKWIWTLKGIRRVLYRLPFVNQAKAKENTIYLCEGEKDADNLADLGVCSTTNSGGANKWDRTFTELLAGADIVLIADKDDAGRDRARKVSGILQQEAKTIKVVELPDIGDQVVKDASDWIAAGGTLADLQSLVTRTPPWTPPSKATQESIRSTLWSITQKKMPTADFNRESADEVVKWLHDRGRFYHHLDRRDFDTVMYFDGVRKLLLPIKSDAFLAWLAETLGINRAERTFNFVTAGVETEGLSDRSNGILPSAYWASTETAFYLSSGPGQMVKITAGSVSIVDNGTDDVLFPYEDTLAPWELTTPRNPFETCALFRDISCAAPHGKDLIMLWVVLLPSDQRTKPPLSASGDVGSGKTRLICGICELLGIPLRISRITKNGEVDLWVSLEAGGIACFDNVDTSIDWLPDALAAASTGGTMERRKLYADTERVSLRARSWVAITSASPTFASDAGLADRLLVARLNRRQGNTADSELSDEIRRNRNAGLSWICDTLSRALADIGPIPSGLNSRHPDFAALAVRVGRALGREDQIIKVLTAAEADKSLFNIENDPIASVLLEILRSDSINGSASDIADRIIEVDPYFEGKLSAKKLAKRLNKLWPHLESLFNATQETGHGGVKRYMFQQPDSGGFGGFETPFSGNSYVRDNNGGFTESASESHQSPWSDADPAAIINVFDGTAPLGSQNHSILESSDLTQYEDQGMMPREEASKIMAELDGMYLNN